MRRVLSLAVAAALGHAAHADPAASTLQMEGGAEADTNIQRVETGEGLMTARVGGPVIRAGFRLDRKNRILDGTYVLGVSTLARLVTTDDAKSENVALLAGDLRWIRAVGKRPVAVGLGLSYADAVPLSTDIGARTFRTAGADAMLVLRKGDDRSLTITVGPRYFAYKPDRTFDWWGPAINARLDITLWEPANGTRSVELGAILGFEARIYDSVASANVCPDDAEPDPQCFAPTSLLRRDRYQRAGVEVTYTGSFIGTVLATLQIDRYLDGLVVQKDLNHQEYTNLDDANRSSLQFRLARRVTEAWSLEGRAAIWRDLGGSLDTEYRRELVYFGGVYSK
jgi:hypothetical protein